MAGHNDPKLLYAINGIQAFHIQDGEESPLTSSGPQTLSLLMVPTSSPFADLSSTIPQNEVADEDFYLHLHLPPELDLPLPATTQIYHQPPTSYLIPRWDMPPASGAFTKITFPRVGYGVTQEDVDTFETILAQCTAFLERARPPLPARKTTGGAGYNPADYAAGGKHYLLDEKSGAKGEIVLVDEDDGSVVGELSPEAEIVEDAKLRMGTKDPVEIEVSQDGKRIEVRPMQEDYLKMAKHPAYKDSSIVKNAAAASRLIVTGSSYIGNVLSNQADNFVSTTKPIPKPLEFKPSTHAHVRRINAATKTAAGYSSKAIGQAANIVQNLAAGMSGHKKQRPLKGYDEKGRPLTHEDGYKPGLLNKSMIAFTTIADGIAYSGKNLLESGGNAATTVVDHRYGPEAGSVAAGLAGGVKNVALVYIDVAGVSRRAVIKSVAKGMLVGRVRGGGDVLVGGGDGGVIPEEDIKRAEEKNGKTGVSNDSVGGAGNAYGPTGGEYNPVGFGTDAPPAYQDYAPEKSRFT